MSGYYRVEVRRANPLSAEEEAAMFVQYRKRRTPARRETIVRQYLYWAAELACRYCGPRMPREDAISAANLGLMQAIEDFDPKRGRRFVTHSYFHIRRTVLTALRETYVINPASGINVVRHQFNLSEKTDEDRAKFRAEKRKVFDRAGQPIECATLDGGPEANGNQASQRHLHAAPDTHEERDSVEDFSMLEVLRERIEDLPEPERTILTMRYLSPDTPRFLDIGKKIGRTKDNVRYLHDRALAKLKLALLKERGLP